METKMINTQGRVIDFNSMLDYRLMNEYIDILAERYPIISVTSIGQTVLGRRIPMLTVGRGKKTVIYIGGQSGTEYQSTAVLLRYINELCEYITADGRVYNCSAAYLFATRTVVVIPMLNPDGVEYCVHGVPEDDPCIGAYVPWCADTSSWQGNARGVLLESNYGDGFEDIITVEPETGALRNYLMFNRDIRLAVTLRKGGNGVVCTHEGTTPPRLNSVGRSIAGLAACGYERLGKNGSLCGFCSKELVIPSFELRSAYSEQDDFFGDYCRQRSSLFLMPTLI